MKIAIHAPKNDKPIPELWAFLSIDPDGTEGIVAHLGSNGWLPLVTGDEANLAAMRMMAREAASLSGRRIRLVKFTARDVLEDI